MCVCVCVCVVTLYRWRAHFSQKSKLNGSSIMRICDWDTCLCHACVGACVCKYAHKCKVCGARAADVCFCSRVHPLACVCTCVCACTVCGGHLSLPVL